MTEGGQAGIAVHAPAEHKRATSLDVQVSD